MTKTTKKKTTKKKAGTDIPLQNIPERKAWTAYEPEFKERAVARLKAGEGSTAIADDMGIPNGSLVTKWALQKDRGEVFKPRGSHNTRPKKKHEEDFAAGLRSTLAKAAAARDDRLEVAAQIVEADGLGSKESPAIAKQIRGLKRQT